MDTPPTETQLVLLSGLLDPLDARSWAERTAQRWAEVAIPVFATWAGHSVIRYLGTSAGQCGAELLDAFLGGRVLPVPCTASVAGPDFTGGSEEVQDAARAWFGETLY